MIKEIQPNIWTWSAYNKEKGYNFNGTVIKTSEGSIIIDPVKLENSESKEALEALGPFKAIYLTNKDHERSAYELRRDWGLPIWIHEADAPRLTEPADHTFKDGQELEGGLEVVHFEHQKSPGEAAFYMKDRCIMIVGDAVIGFPPGGLKLLPPMKYEDVSKTLDALKKLQQFKISALLVGDGEPVLGGVERVLAAFFEAGGTCAPRFQV